MRISDWSSDVCSSDLPAPEPPLPSSLRWKRKSVSKERRRYSPLEPSQELARRSRSVEQSLSMLVPKSYPRTRCLPRAPRQGKMPRSEEHTSELQSLMRRSYAVFCLKKKTTHSQRRPPRDRGQKHEQHTWHIPTI